MADEEDLPVERIAKSLERLERIAALLATRDLERNDQLRTLAALGYKHSEIADMLGMKANTVTKSLSRMGN